VSAMAGVDTGWVARWGCMHEARAVVSEVVLLCLAHG